MPQWANQISAAFHRQDKQTTTSFKTEFALLSTLVRFDIPILGFIDRYVLYTDADVMFLRDLNFGDFGHELPMTFAIGTEPKAGADFKVQGTSKVNTGVLLMNIP